MWILIVMYALMIPCAILFIHNKHKLKANAPLTVALKAASTTIIALTAIVGVTQIRESMHIYAILVAAGLVLGLVGDIVISQPESGSFLSGMFYFALGHICYIAAFLRISTHKLGAVPVFIVVYIIFAIVVTRLSKKFENMLIPTMIYGAVITTMLSLSTTVPFSVPRGYILLAAAVLFVISDSLLARNTFVSAKTTDEISFLRHCCNAFHTMADTNRILDWVCLCCYFAAQSLFAVSIFCL